MTKSLNTKYVAMIGAILVLFSFATLAHANPFYTGTKAMSAAATSTQSYLTPGTGTTTLPVYDSYEQNGTNETNSGNITIPNTVAVLLDGNASSSTSVLNAVCEFSDDGINWYQNELFPATTTVAVNIAVPSSFTFAFATSTIGGVVISQTRFQKLVECPIPLRYVRLTVTDTGAPFSVWREIVPTKQRN